MRKFLKLIDENRPGSNSQYVISIKGPAEFEDIIVSGDEYTFDLHQKIKAIVEGRADVVVHEEDQEIKSGPGVYDVDAEVGKLASKAKSGVAGMAGKAIGTSAQKAKAAMKERENVAKDAIKVYKKDTQALKQAVQNK
jgi:hypothetical protein|tara:strand:- start:42 stop:455 length:414 start_codon:yes stop_codon:yes gene_type:complete